MTNQKLSLQIVPKWPGIASCDSTGESNTLNQKGGFETEENWAQVVPDFLGQG